MTTSLIGALQEKAGDTISLRDLLMKRVYQLEKYLHPDTDTSIKTYQEQAALADCEIHRLVTMSAEDCETAALASRDRGLAVAEELRESHDQHLRRFVRAKAMVTAWRIPAVLEEFRARVLAELNEDWPKPDTFVPRPHETGEEWRAREIAHVRQSFDYYQERIAKEREIDERNRLWAEAFVVSLADNETKATAETETPPPTQPEAT